MTVPNNAQHFTKALLRTLAAHDLCRDNVRIAHVDIVGGATSQYTVMIVADDIETDKRQRYVATVICHENDAELLSKYAEERWSI